jgi:SAM-dependent methyltransferase
VRSLRQLRIQLATLGLGGMARLAVHNRFRPRLQAYEECRALIEHRRGLEIGGPSAIFARGGAFPVYPLLDQLDNCDFAGDTIWHGRAAEGSPFQYDHDRPPGRVLIRDATSLDGIPDAAYDVVLSSHTLEHVANPLRALAEWKRVVGPEGPLVLVVPHVENTFDHRRPVTTLEHIEADFARSTTEDDTTHVEEFVELCDLSRVPDDLTREAFDARIRDQAANRTVHHHVFDTDLVVRLLDRAGYQLLSVETALPFHIVAVARAGGNDLDNGAFLAPGAGWRRGSAFRRDRVGASTLQIVATTRSSASGDEIVASIS